MVFTCCLISKSSILFTNLLGIVLSALVTVGITITFMFHSLLVLQQGPATYLSFHFLLILHCGLLRTTKSTIRQVLLFCWLSRGLVIWLRLFDLFLFSSHYWFLVRIVLLILLFVLFLVAAISLSLLFFLCRHQVIILMYQCYPLCWWVFFLLLF